MTDETAHPAPTDPGGNSSWRIPLLVGALVLAIVVVVAFVVSGGDDEDESEPTASEATSTTPSGSPSPSESTPATDSPDTTSTSSSAAADGDPVTSPVIDQAVRAAIKADFPALVPSGVPAGWTVVSARYAGGSGGRWTIELTEPGGAPVTLLQTSQSSAALVAETLGAGTQPSGTVDLGDYGTGRWKVYTAGGTTAILTRIAETSALVTGPDQESVVALAQELLTAEDANLPEAE